MTKRLQTLVVPYLALNTFWFFVSAGLIWLSVRYFGSKDVLDFSWASYLRALGLDLWHTPVISALWYVRCLMIFFLFMPAVTWLMRKREWGSWSVVAVVVTISTAYEYFGCNLFPLFGFNVRGLPFFMLGIHLLLWPICVNRQIGLLVAIGGAFLFESLGFAVLAIGATLAILWFAFPELEAPGWLRTTTFPIYVLHQMILYILLIPLRFLKIDGFMELRYVGLIAFSIALSILVARFVSRYMPSVARIVFGGRV